MHEIIMPYGRRRYSAKRRSSARRNTRRIKYRRPSARNQRRQILTNQRQIVSLRKHVNLTKQRNRWGLGFTEIQVTAYPMIIPLTNGPSTSSVALTNTGQPVGWYSTMSDRPQDTPFLRNKCVINTQWLDMSITGGNEATPLYLTAFLVQLQEDTATQVYAETGSMSTLTRDSDYCCPNVTSGSAAGQDSGYGAYLNPDRFKILKRMEFSTSAPTIGWPGGPPGGNTGSGLGAALKRHQFKVNYGNTTIKSTGDGAQLQTIPYAEIDPKHKRFIIIFSDNSALDGEFPNVALSGLVTGYSCE